MGKKGGPPLGSRNAQKWNLSRIEKVLKAIEEYLYENDKCCYIGEAISEVNKSATLDFRIYRDIWGYFDHILRSPIGIDEGKESNSTKELRESLGDWYQSIETLLEGRLVSRGLSNKANVGMAIFILKNHGWDDKSGIDLTTDGEKIAQEPKIEFTVVNSNPNVEFTTDGKIKKDKTGERSQGTAGE